MVSDPMQIICSVLSLRDSCVMYPSCPQCMSRLQKKPSERRCCCPKCGFTSSEEDISYRYRLSLNVKRCSDIYAVTVFGSCLNPYFGIPAVGLQRFYDETLKNAEEPQSDSVRRLLLKAVEDCFVGRQFEFGIKLRGHETREMLLNEQGLPALLAGNGISREFVASRITLPPGAAGGSSVLCYFKKLLQASCALDVCGLPNPEGPPASPDTLALNSFECSSDSFSQSASWHSYNVHRFPRYWERSPGIITSSAEQDERSSSKMELNGTDVGSRWRRRTSCRSPQTCSHGEPSCLLSSQCCSEDVSCNDSSEGHSLGFLTCHDSGETTAASPPNGLQRARLSLPDTAEPTSSVTESGNYKSPEPSKVDIKQSEHLGLKFGWRGVFREGEDDLSSFQEGLPVCGWNSKLSNSSAWEDLPFSESWGEFIGKANGPPEVSQKNKACGSVKIMEGKMSKEGCSDEKQRCTNNDSSATEHSRNGIILSGGTTSRALGKVQDSTAVAQQPFRTCPGVYCTENSHLPANDTNVKHNKVFRALMSTSGDLVHASEDQERGKGDSSVLLPGLRGLTAQGQNKIKEFGRVGGEARKQGTGFHGNYCISEHNQDGQGATLWDFEREEPALTDRGPSGAEDAYDTSADLFGSCQNSVGIEEVEEESMTPPECGGSKALTSCHPRMDAYRGDHLTPVEKMPKPSTDKAMLGSEISDPLHFVPFSQSTPVSGDLIPSRHLPHGGKDQTPGRLSLKGNVSWHHGYSKTESESLKENVSHCRSEDTAPLSMAEITHSSKPQCLTRSVQRPQPVDRYHCKRILLTSRGKNSCRKILSSRIDNICEITKTNKIRCTLNNAVPSRPKLEDCIKSAHLGREGHVVTEGVTSTEFAARQYSCPLDTSASCPYTDRDGMDFNWSADLFADSFGI